MLRPAQVAPSFVLLKMHGYLGDPRATYVLEPREVLVSASGMLERDKQTTKEVNDCMILTTTLLLTII